MKIKLEVIEHSRISNLSVIMDWSCSGDKYEKVDLGLIENWKVEEDEGDIYRMEKRVEVVVDEEWCSLVTT